MLPDPEYIGANIPISKAIEIINNEMTDGLYEESSKYLKEILIGIIKKFRLEVIENFNRGEIQFMQIIQNYSNLSEYTVKRHNEVVRMVDEMERNIMELENELQEEKERLQHYEDMSNYVFKVTTYNIETMKICEEKVKEIIDRLEPVMVEDLKTPIKNIVSKFSKTVQNIFNEGLEKCRINDKEESRKMEIIKEKLGELENVKIETKEDKKEEEQEKPEVEAKQDIPIEERKPLFTNEIQKELQKIRLKK